MACLEYEDDLMSFPFSSINLESKHLLSSISYLSLRASLKFPGFPFSTVGAVYSAHTLTCQRDELVSSMTFHKHNRLRCVPS